MLFVLTENLEKQKTNQNLKQKENEDISQNEKNQPKQTRKSSKKTLLIISLHKFYQAIFFISFSIRFFT